MMYTALLVAAAAVASAQYTYNSTTGVFTCPPDNLNGAFCAGESLQTNIIIRCNNGVGQPGNCNDNLAGYFPIGVNYAPCFQTSDTSGDAACSKNCIVEGGSGNYNGTTTLPNCTPSSSSTAASSTTSVSTTSTSGSASSTSSASGAASTTTTTCTTTTTTSTASITSSPSSGFSTTTLSPSGGSTATGNGTITTATSATKTPTGPTTTSSGTSFTGAANAMGVSSGAGLAGVGLLIAYLL